MPRETLAQAKNEEFLPTIKNVREENFSILMKTAAIKKNREGSLGRVSLEPPKEASSA